MPGAMAPLALHHRGRFLRPCTLLQCCRRAPCLQSRRHSPWNRKHAEGRSAALAAVWRRGGGIHSPERRGPAATDAARVCQARAALAVQIAGTRRNISWMRGVAGEWKPNAKFGVMIRPKCWAPEMCRLVWSVAPLGAAIPHVAAAKPREAGHCCHLPGSARYLLHLLEMPHSSRHPPATDSAGECAKRLRMAYRWTHGMARGARRRIRKGERQVGEKHGRKPKRLLW